MPAGICGIPGIPPVVDVGVFVVPVVEPVDLGAGWGAHGFGSGSLFSLPSCGLVPVPVPSNCEQSLLVATNHKDIKL